MPPKTAIRFSSGITLSTGSVGADRAVLVTSVASLVAERVTDECVVQHCSEVRVRGFDQDRAHINPPVGDYAAVVTDQMAVIETFHHFRRHALFRTIAPLSSG